MCPQTVAQFPWWSLTGCEQTKRQRAESTLAEILPVVLGLSSLTQCQVGPGKGTKEEAAPSNVSTDLKQAAAESMPWSV